MILFKLIKKDTSMCHNQYKVLRILISESKLQEIKVHIVKIN